MEICEACWWGRETWSISRGGRGREGGMEICEACWWGRETWSISRGGRGREVWSMLVGERDLEYF